MGGNIGGVKQRMKKQERRSGFLRSLVLGTAVLLVMYCMHALISTGDVMCTSVWTVHMEETLDKGHMDTEQGDAAPEPEAEFSAINNADYKNKKPAASVDRSDWKLILLDADHPMPDDYELQLTDLGDGLQFDKRAAGALQGMLEEAKAQGLFPVVCSAYRSEERQAELFEEQVLSHIAEGMTEEQAETEARRHVSVSGHSEHGLGLAVDIVSNDYQELEEDQENTPEYQWLLKHCADYGFILRYPKHKSDITGVIYEPWHFRYVGKQAAKEIMNRGITLEEYLEES